MSDRSAVRLEPFDENDFPLVEKLMGDPAMTEYLEGPETHEKLVDRHERYMRYTGEEGTGGMFKIVDEETGEALGSVGYWERDWRGDRIWETGWSVLREFQGRGIATDATAQVVERARAQRKHRYMHAFPTPENAASNAICRKLGFEFLEEVEFEFPPGHFGASNDWRLDLTA
jgi:RimJ/RimL family protein N-acetyltransferase